MKIKKGDAAQLETYKQAQQILEDGNTIFSRAAAEKLEMAHLKELNLLTAKPFIYVFNADEGVLASEEKQAELRELVAPAEAVSWTRNLRLTWWSFPRRRPARCWK
ncbi:GTP-binding protein YchF [Rothia dentocariosa]|nr:GTP-binding protein YchF [Rothia dentocariosa]